MSHEIEYALFFMIISIKILLDGINKITTRKIVVYFRKNSLFSIAERVIENKNVIYIGINKIICTVLMIIFNVSILIGVDNFYVILKNIYILIFFDISELLILWIIDKNVEKRK
jgi:hypothetical protein